MVTGNYQFYNVLVLLTHETIFGFKSLYSFVHFSKYLKILKKIVCCTSTNKKKKEKSSNV